MNEIFEDAVLRYFGACLALTNAITAYFWIDKESGFSLLTSQSVNRTCWPFLPGCTLLSFPNIALFNFVMLFMGIASLFVAIGFISKPYLRAAFVGLLIVSSLRAVVFFSSYSLMGNYHYMNQLVLFCYLFLPNKKELLSYLIVGFYIAAGSLKFGPEWLSGASLIRPSWVTGGLLKFLLFYVVILEMVGVVGLLAKSRNWRYFALFQLICFHLFSWQIVGYYYPLIMFCLLSLYVLTFIFDVDTPRLENLLGARIAGSTKLVLLLFAAAQVFPNVLASDPALSGIARISSLNMLDANPLCSAQAMIFEKEKIYHYLDFHYPGSIRATCDPLLFMTQVDELCRRENSERMDFALNSRRATDENFRKVLEIKNICQVRYPLPWAELFSTFIGAEN